MLNHFTPDIQPCRVLYCFCTFSLVETSTDISRALSLVNKWATTLLFPEEDPFDEIKPVHTEIVEIGQEEKVIVLNLPLNDEVTSNVRRISVQTDFDGVTPPSLDIQVRQSNYSSVTIFELASLSWVLPRFGSREIC